MNWFNKLKEYIDEFIINPSAWRTLAFRGDKEKIFWYGLQHLVDRTEVNNLKLISKDVNYLRSVISSTEFVESLKSFYEMLGFQKPTQESLGRLITNAKTLLESAYTAYLVKLVSTSNCNVGDFLQQILKLIEAISNKTIELTGLSDLSWANLDATSVLNKAFDNVDILAKKANYKFSTTKARYWTFYWLKQHQSLFLPRQRSVKVMGYMLGKAKVSHLKVQLLKNTESVELVEDPETCLLPFGKAYVDGIERAWRKRGNVNCCWTLQTEREAGEDGDSLSAAVATAFASLAEDSYLADDRVVLGIISEADDNLEPVDFEVAKLKAAARQGVKLAALVKRKPGLNPNSLSEQSGCSHLDENTIAELKAQNLNVCFIETLQDAIDFVTVKECPRYYVDNIPDHFLPRTVAINEIKKLLLNNQAVGLTGSNRVGLQGMGGIGKTWLARELAHSKDPEIWKAFPDGIFWVTVGNAAIDQYLINRQAGIIEKLTKEQVVIRDVIDGKGKLQEALENKSCLIIVDDIWTHDHFQAFNVLGKTSKMLITSRDEELLKDPNSANSTVYSVEAVSEELAMQMLAEYAGQSSESLPAEAYKAAKEWCRYLPFGLALCGSLIKACRQSWKDVLASLEEYDLSELKTHSKNLDVLITKSVEALEEEKKYYYALAVFRQKAKLPAKAIVTVLTNNPYTLTERKANRLLGTFVSRALLSKSGDAYELHDLLYLYLGNKANKSKSTLSQALLNIYLDKYKDWAKVEDDGYFYQNSAYHFKEAGFDSEFKSLLLNFDYMQAKLNATDVNALIADYYLEARKINLSKNTLGLSQNNEKNEAIELLLSALLLSEFVLKQNKHALAHQIVGRLTGHRKTNTYLHNITNLVMQIPGLYPAFLDSGHVLHQAGDSLQCVLSGHENAVGGALALTNGRLLSWSEDSTLRLWNHQGQLLQVLKGHTKAVNGALALTDGRLLSWSEDSTLRLWDDQGQPLQVLKGHVSRVRGVLALNGGKLLSWSEDSTLQLWNNQGQLLQVLKGHTKAVNGALILTDGRLVSWSDDCTLRLWDDQGQPLQVFKGNNYGVRSVLALTNGHLLCWSHRWSEPLQLLGSQGQVLQLLKGHVREVTGVIVLNKGQYGQRILSWSLLGDCILRLWDEEGKPVGMLKGHSDWIWGALELNDGRILSWSSDCSLRLWDSQGQHIQTLKGHKRTVRGALELNDGCLLSWSEDCTLWLWNNQGQPLQVFKGHTDAVTGVLALDNTHFLSWCGRDKTKDHTLRLWDIQRQPIHKLKEHLGAIKGALIIENNTHPQSGKHFLSWSEDRMLLWDSQGQPLHTLTRHTTWTVGALALANGTFVSWALNWFSEDALDLEGDRLLCVWDMNGNLLKAIHHGGIVENVVLLPNSNFFVKIVNRYCEFYPIDKSYQLWLCDINGQLISHLDKFIPEKDQDRFVVWVQEHNLNIDTLHNKSRSVTKYYLKFKGTHIELYCGREDILLTDFFGDANFTCAYVSSDGDIVAGDVMGHIIFLRMVK